MGFIGDDFLLQSKTARRLYRDFAETQPILDYHTHLPASEIARNRRFENLFEIWLEGDHYKWRAMRANGVEERYCTGNASPYEKFLAWAQTAPHTLRNPLYHWTHLELKRYFEIDDLLDRDTAASIWKRANALLATDELRPWGIFRKFRVQAVCTTDDPTDDLAAHREIAASECRANVYPTFRPDKALKVDQPEAFNAWMERLSTAANIHIERFQDFLDALRQRHDKFHEVGCRLSDHGLNHCYADFPAQSEAAAIFDNARTGQAASIEEHARFAAFMMLFFGHLDAEKGWTKQLHLGAQRSNNTRALKALGPDTGFDSIGGWPQAASLGAYLDRLEQESALPKIVLYNVNPSDNFIFATMAGNFPKVGVRGRIQFGSGWWFLDQKEGIEWQLNALSNTGLLSRFVGMLTDSRSFMSYPRHEYFRRVLCNLLGNDIETGLLPDDDELIGRLIEDVCFNNAKNFFGLELPQIAAREEERTAIGSR